MKMKTRKSIVLKCSMKNLMTSLLPIVKKIVNKKINQIKSSIMRKIQPNTLKRVSNREIKSLENNFSVKATKNIINTPKIAIEKSPIVAKANVVTSSKIATKAKKVSKPKIVDKPKIVIEKSINYGEHKNRVIKQLKKHIKKLFDVEKSKYLDNDDEEYKGIRDLEHLFEEINENDDDDYKPILVKSSFNESYKEYESGGDKEKTLTVEKYLNTIMPYLKELVNNHKAINNSSNEWKIQLNMGIKFVSLKDTEDIRTFYVWSGNEEIRLGNETDDIVKSLTDSFLNNYQKEQEVLREGSNFVFECVDLLSYHIHKTSLKRGSSYIKSTEWLANKKAIINPKKY